MAIPKLPDDAVLYRQTAVFTEATVPGGLLNDHRTKDGTWGMIRVLEGKLAYRIKDSRRPAIEFVLTPKIIPAVIEPTITHEIEPCGSVRFLVEFYRRGGTSP
ncbi:MAG TPA: DUF1971 domain-containing protein [Stellaceae bacterium]|jgi:tellurite resistance-related uncharacterized protein|nr:DUF1971 domain-containing protein [Stellaceae bacterium]